MFYKHLLFCFLFWDGRGANLSAQGGENFKELLDHPQNSPCRCRYCLHPIHPILFVATSWCSLSGNNITGPGPPCQTSTSHTTPAWPLWGEGTSPDQRLKACLLADKDSGPEHRGSITLQADWDQTKSKPMGHWRKPATSQLLNSAGFKHRAVGLGIIKRLNNAADFT